jgi:glycerophosphoryl diester phosphodiesterase
MWWVILLVIIYIFLVAPSREKRQLKQTKYAHRGFHSEDTNVKENSLEAFRLAVENGYGIELDVQLSKDRQVVVYHDNSLFRLEKDKRLVSDCTLEELREFQIPLLTEVFELVDGKVDLVIELKSGSLNRVNSFCQTVYALLKEYQGSYCIESFNPLIVAWFKKYAPEVTRGQLVAHVKEYPVLWQGVLLNTMFYQAWSRPHFIAVDVASARWNIPLQINKWLGAKFVLWTVRSQDEAKRKNIEAIIFEFFEPDCVSRG